MKRQIIIGFSLFTILLAGCEVQEADTYTNAYHSLEIGDYSTASSLFDKALSEGANKKMVYRGEGMAFLGRNDYDNAIKSFENALHESNGIIEDADIDISYYLAVAYFKAGNVAEAENIIESVINLRPSQDTAYYLRGKINLIKGNKDAAMSDYDKAIELNPGDYDKYIKICEDLREYGYDSESNAYIEKAMSSGGKITAYRKGVFEYYLGSYTDARNDLESARKTEKNENLLLYLGKTYEALGDAGYALSIYEEALAANPNNGKIYNELALIKIDQKDYKGAIDIINLALEQQDVEGMQNLLYNRIASYEYLYDFKTAESYMKEYLELYPDDASAQREYKFLKTR